MSTPIDSVTAAVSQWWDGIGRSELHLLKCEKCGAAWLPFTPNCPDCGIGGDPRWIRSNGTGTLYSWVGIRHSVGFPDDVPFVVASVLLDEGAMIYGRLRVPVDAPLAGDEHVRARFVPGTPPTVEFDLAENTRNSL